MPAVSKAQQRFMGMVHAAQQGEKPASDKVAKAAASMSDKSAKDFASTPTKGLPDKIKELVLAELRSVKTIQNDYTNTLNAIQQNLQAYKTTKDETLRKKFVENLKKLGEVKKKLAKELDASVSDIYKDAELNVDEANTTGNVQGYSTPNAFSKPGQNEKERGEHQASLTGYTFDRVISEMGLQDVNVSRILHMYDTGGNFTKKKVAAAVCHDPNASREKILKTLLRAGHRDTVGYADKLGL